MTAFRVFLEQSNAADRLEQVFGALSAYGAALQIEFMSYHILRRNLHSVGFEAGFVWHTFPAHWVRHYREQGYFEFDPIIQTAAFQRDPFHWFEVGRLIPLSAAQRAYLDDLAGFGFTDGFAVPIYGPAGEVIYFGAGTASGPLNFNAEAVRELQFACHHAHARCASLRGQAAEGVRLSPRETEVLQAIALGQSNSVIADRLDVSAHTVDTLVRRLFEKLDVHSRIGAVLKAVGLGLVTI
jgi:DNA-binding CsgD family transcriptional regulator